jgi:hypothetical protein
VDKCIVTEKTRLQELDIPDKRFRKLYYIPVEENSYKGRKSICQKDLKFSESPVINKASKHNH